jgi:hypothetical protein
VADLDPALVQQVRDIAQRQQKADVQHHRQANDLGTGLKISERPVLGHPPTVTNSLPSLNPTFF